MPTMAFDHWIVRKPYAARGSEGRCACGSTDSRTVLAHSDKGSDVQEEGHCDRRSAVRDIAMVIGLSILLPYFRGYFLSPIKSTGMYADEMLTSSFFAFAVAFALCAVAVFAVGDRALRAMDRRWAPLAAGVMGSAGMFFLWVPSGLGAVEEPLCVVGTVVNVVFFVASLLRYAGALERLDMVRVVILTSVAFALSFVNNLFYLLPDPLEAALCVLSPLVCALCAPPAPRGADWQDGRRNGGTLFFSAAPVEFAALLSLFCLTGNFIRGVTNPWFAIDGVTINSMYMTLTNCALVVATLVALKLKAPVNRVVFFNWIACMLLFFAGVLVMSLTAPETAYIGSNLATTSRVGFTLLMLLFSLSPECRRGMSLARRIGLFLLVPEAVAAVVRYAVVPEFLKVAGAERSVLFTDSGTVVIFILSVAIGIVLGRLLLRSSESATVDGPAGGREVSSDGVIACIADAYGLTPRETDVVRYVSQGYSLEKAAGMLGVTINTVRTHMRSIYAKLGIHNRQDLIDMTHRMRDGL